jgi:hypothetical protein
MRPRDQSGRIFHAFAESIRPQGSKLASFAIDRAKSIAGLQGRYDQNSAAAPEAFSRIRNNSVAHPSGEPKISTVSVRSKVQHQKGR